MMAAVKLGRALRELGLSASVDAEHTFIRGLAEYEKLSHEVRFDEAVLGEKDEPDRETSQREAEQDAFCLRLSSGDVDAGGVRRPRPCLAS